MNENDIRKALRGLDTIEADGILSPATARRAKRRRTLTAALSGLGVVVLIAAAGLGADSLLLSREPQVPAGPEPEVVATIEVGRVMGLDADRNGVWTANYEDGTVGLIDPATTEVLERVEVDDVLGAGVSDVHATDTDVWLAASDNLAVGHLDPATLQVSVAADVGSSSFYDISADTKEVWVAQADPPSFDPVTSHGTRIASAASVVPAPGGQFATYSDIASGDEGVWALGESEGSLAAISPVDGEPRVALTNDELLVMGGQADIAVGHGYVWVESSGEATTRVARFDPATSEIQAITVDGQGGVMAVSGDALWLLTHDDDHGLLWRIDPSTLDVAAPFQMNGEFQLADIAYGFGSIWVTHDFELLSRIAIEPGVEAPIATASPEHRGSGEVCDQGGPWIDCQEARWLRRVVGEAGFELIGDNASALEFAAGPYNLYGWNAAGDRPVEEVASEEGYEPRDQIDAFSDGTRLLWAAQDLHIYLSSMDGTSVGELPTSIIDRLIDASRVVAREADLSGAKPQPTPTTDDQRSEQTDDGRVRVWPVTEDVVDEGKYLFEAPHCGLGWMIDFDGSFWDATEPDDYGRGDNYPFFYNGDQGAITFTGSNTAIYQASTGEEIRLERLSGPIVIDPCA